MEKYGKTTQRNDPFVHFYEDFLKAYNPEKRDARGVWYTPATARSVETRRRRVA